MENLSLMMTVDWSWLKVPDEAKGSCTKKKSGLTLELSQRGGGVKAQSKVNGALFATDRFPLGSLSSYLTVWFCCVVLCYLGWLWVMKGCVVMWFLVHSVRGVWITGVKCAQGIWSARSQEIKLQWFWL